jgi:hypothetical protein
VRQTIFALSLLAALIAATTAQADEGAAIAKRLEAAHYTVVPYKRDRTPKPAKSFYVVVDYSSTHAFELFVEVYRSHAVAETAIGQDYVWLDKYGTLGASQLEVDGRVLFWGATGAMNHGSGPSSTLPPARFHRVVTLARGS